MAENTASVRLTGSAGGCNGCTVQARLLSRGLEVQDFLWSSLGKVTGEKWSGAIMNIPVGGPYRLELRVAGSPHVLAVEDILVGDLWVLGGQSNMEGCGILENVEQPHPLVHSFDLTDQWLLAQEPLHRLIDAVDPVHWEGKKRIQGLELEQDVAKIWRGAGLGLPFAVEMVRRTGVPMGLVPCAHGGSTMDQWNPRLKQMAGGSLYGSMLRRVHAIGGKVAGVLWYQGESETYPGLTSEFQQKFENFVAAAREDFGESALPFYYVQIGRFVTAPRRRSDSAWNDVQEAQRKAEMNLEHAGMAASLDVELDDIIHLSTEGLKRVGHRLANLACRDIFADIKRWRDLKRGPRPASITMEKHSVRDEYLMHVRFSGVNSGLKSCGRVAGFSIHSPDGIAMPVIFKTRIDPEDRSVVLLYFHVHYGFGTDQLPLGATLRYGWGKDPYCNLTDGEDMAVPAFGPITIR